MSDMSDWLAGPSEVDDRPAVDWIQLYVDAVADRDRLAARVAELERNILAADDQYPEGAVMSLQALASSIRAAGLDADADPPTPNA